MPACSSGTPVHAARIRAGIAPRFTLVSILAAALAVGACSAFTPASPPATPTDFAGVVAELESQGIDVNRVVSGEAGCDDQRLSRTAIAFDARGADQASPVRIHLYAFRNRQVYDELRAAVDACARSYVTDPAAFGSVDAPPYVLAGSGPWPQAFKDALRTAIQRAAVGG